MMEDWNDGTGANPIGIDEVNRNSAQPIMENKKLDFCLYLPILTSSNS